MSRVLVVSPEAVGDRMAGPAIRSWELAAALACGNEVTLAAPVPIRTAGPRGVTLVEARQSILSAVTRSTEVIIAQPGSYATFQALRAGDACRVVDLYDPSIIEGLEIHRDRSLGDQLDRQQQDLEELLQALSLGDYFVCASDAQRGFWIGLLAATGRLSPAAYRRDHTLRTLIDLCPFGVSDGEPPLDPGCLRRRFPSIGEGDPVALWTGGIWNWFDPLTLLHAMALAVRSVPRLRLVFLGAGHPESGVPAMAMEAEAHRLAIQLNLIDRHVFFNDEWLPYAERGAYLRDASVATSLHFDTIETTFAFRTRLLDHLWAGLPSIVTTGDTLGDAIVAAGAGIAVAPGDTRQVAAALVHLANETSRAAFASNARILARDYRWSVVTQRLAAFCQAPSPAADRGEGRSVSRQHWATVRRVRRAWSTLRHEGPGVLRNRVARYVRTRFR